MSVASTPMNDWMTSSAVVGFCVAVGIGLLIGLERERRKGSGAHRAPAGIRTFTVAALAGAVSIVTAGEIALVATVLAVGALAALGYYRVRSNDPGLTTEVALVLTTLLGGLAMKDAAWAAGLGAALALLLASKDRLHHLVGSVLSAREVQDALLLAGVVLIVLPLAPDKPMGPFAAVNPHTLVTLVVLVMLINAAGYVAMRLFGARYGLPLAGLLGGFVSSTATIHAMGSRIRSANVSTPSVHSALHTREIEAAASAGGVLSSVPTSVQMLLVIALIHPPLAQEMVLPMLCGLAIAICHAVLLMRQSDTRAEVNIAVSGRAFDPLAAVGFAATVGALFVVAAALHHWLGANGLWVASAVGGLADAHAAAAVVASAAAQQSIPLAAAIDPVLLGFSSNAAMKVLVAYQSGGARYAARIGSGIGLMVAAVWIARWLA